MASAVRTVTAVKLCRMAFEIPVSIQGVIRTTNVLVSIRCGMPVNHDGPHKARVNGNFAATGTQAIATWGK